MDTKLSGLCTRSSGNDASPMLMVRCRGSSPVSAKSRAITRFRSRSANIAAPGAAMFAERLRKRVMARDFADTGEDPLHLTISIGLASFPDERVHSPDSFVSIADQALYRAKNEGRNLVRQ